MALGTCLGADGFDHYADTDWAKHWSAVPGLSTSVGISSKYSLNGRGQGVSLGNGTMGMNLASNYAGGMICGRFEIISGTLPTRVLLQVMDGGTEQCSMRLDGSGRLIITQNGTQRGTTGPTIAQGGIYFFEWQFAFSGAGGTASSFDLHVAGASVASGSGVDLTGTANNQWNAFQWAIPNGIVAYLDDMIWFDTAAGTDFLGGGALYTQYTAGTGTHTDFTPSGGTNFGNVQEEYEDGDLSFNMSATQNHIDSFTFQKLPFGTGTIPVVQTEILCRQDIGTQRTLSQLTRSSGGTDNVGTAYNPSTIYGVLRDIRQTKVGGGAWDVTEVNASEIGYKLTT